MWQFIIPAVIIGGAVIIVFMVIMRHFPQAAAIDLESLPAEQEAAMKAALMERRLKRKLGEMRQKMVPFLRRFFGIFTDFFNRLYRRVQTLEQGYRRKPHSMNAAEQADVRSKIQTLMEQAKASASGEEWTEAENKYIEILSWDPKHLESYAGLASVYLSRKEFTQAKETFAYLFRLVQLQESGEEAQSLFSLPLSEEALHDARFAYVQCLQNLDDVAQAKIQMDLVLADDANNPKYLDKLVELSILIKDRKAAREALARLKEVNPQNQKLALFEDKLRQL